MCGEYKHPSLTSPRKKKKSNAKSIKFGVFAPLVLWNDVEFHRPRVDLTDLMPFARTDAVARMAGRIISWGDDLGLSIVEERRGGCSDGNVAASVGCPVVDGLGVVGGNMHSPEEWMESQSLSERTALLALTAQRFYEL